MLILNVATSRINICTLSVYVGVAASGVIWSTLVYIIVLTSIKALNNSTSQIHSHTLSKINLSLSNTHTHQIGMKRCRERETQDPNIEEKKEKALRRKVMRFCGAISYLWRKVNGPTRNEGPARGRRNGPQVDPYFSLPVIPIP